MTTDKKKFEAFDISVFEGNKYLADLVKYKVVGILGMDMGLEWGETGKPSLTSHTFNCARSGQTTWAEKPCLPNFGLEPQARCRSMPER